MAAPILSALGKAAAAAGRIARRASARRAARKGGSGLWLVVGSFFTLVVAAVLAPVLLIVTLTAMTPFPADQKREAGTGGIGMIASCVTVRPVSAVPASTSNGQWDASQRAVAHAVVTALVARGGVTYQAVYVTMMTAMQESGLRNVNHGDALRADTIGILQIGPEHGTLAQRMDPGWSANNFLDRLFAVKDWTGLDPWEAAHRAQVNERASDYQKWWAGGDAKTMVDGLLDASKCSRLPLDGAFNIVSGYGPRTPGAANESSWHPAWDFNQRDVREGSPVYAIRPGTVTMVGGGAANALGITDPETGFEVQYLHMYPVDVLVKEGDVVQVGQQIGRVGGAFGYAPHLDLRIYAGSATAPQEQSGAFPRLKRSSDERGPSGYVHPAEYMAWFGVQLCPPDRCTFVTDEGR